MTRVASTWQLVYRSARQEAIEILLQVMENHAEAMFEKMQYRLIPGAREALREYIALRMVQPHFANARSLV